MQLRRISWHLHGARVAQLRGDANHPGFVTLTMMSSIVLLAAVVILTRFRCHSFRNSGHGRSSIISIPLNIMVTKCSKPLGG